MAASRAFSTHSSIRSSHHVTCSAQKSCCCLTLDSFGSGPLAGAAGHRRELWRPLYALWEYALSTCSIEDARSSRGDGFMPGS